MPLRDQGTWAPRLIAPAVLHARKPHSSTWEAAAAFPVPALTAEQVLGDALSIQAGEQLLVNGAGGVTGGLLVALGKLRGAEVIATAGPSSQQRVSALGARHVIDYHDQDATALTSDCACSGRGVARRPMRTHKRVGIEADASQRCELLIGGTGLIGSKTVAILRQRGHEVVAASPDTGVNAITGEGLEEEWLRRSQARA